MSFISATAPAPQTRNPWLAGFNWGVASAAAKSVTLRDLLTQIDANTKDLHELTGLIDAGWKDIEWDDPDVAIARGKLLDKYQLPHTIDHTVLINPMRMAPNGVGGYSEWDRAGGNVDVVYDGTIRTTINGGWLGTLSTTAFNINHSTPPYAVSAGWPPGAYLLSQDPAPPTGSLTGVYYTDGLGWFKTSQAELNANTYQGNRPSETQLTDWNEGFKDAAQQKTALAQGQQSFMVQLTSDKSNLELFATGILQRFDSLMRDLAGNLRS